MKSYYESVRKISKNDYYLHVVSEKSWSGKVITPHGIVKAWGSPAGNEYYAGLEFVYNEIYYQITWERKKPFTKRGFAILAGKWVRSIVDPPAPDTLLNTLKNEIEDYEST